MLQSIDARTGLAFGPVFADTPPAELDRVVQDAAQAFAHWQASDGDTRASLLAALADTLEAHRDELAAIADSETGLGLPRLAGEIGRSAAQLRHFAGLVREGAPFRHIDTEAVAGTPPAARPALRRVGQPLGPVAMFSASNFPFAFSVLGCDTTSALAAGCSVVAKAHPGHPQTSLRTHALVQAVLDRLRLPAGLIGHVQGAGHELGVALIQHPLIAAGAFTGSTRGGAALQAAARQRPRPIPFYGELGAVNPVVALPSALEAAGPALAQGLALFAGMGSCQFCTNPSLLVLRRDVVSDGFVTQLLDALRAQQPHAMVTPAIRRAFEAGIQAQLNAGARALLREPGDAIAPRPFVAEVDAATFVTQPVLHDEVFGPSTLIVRVDSVADTLQVLLAIGGSLTATLWGADEDTPDNQALVRGATAIAGRVVFQGLPTSVAITAAQQHGGPWPSSTEPMSTSVGDAALQRFLRPVALQDAPSWLRARDGRPC